MAEKKNWIEIVLMPVVITLVGIVGTFLITSQHEKNSQQARLAQLESARELAEADRQIKIIEICCDSEIEKYDYQLIHRKINNIFKFFVKLVYRISSLYYKYKNIAKNKIRLIAN